MKDSITLGATPAEETCAQVGVTPNYHEIALLECQVYRRQLLRMYKAEHNPDGEDWGLPKGVTLRISNNAHDSGTYHEVNVCFESSDADEFSAQLDVALWFDDNMPGTWDETARRELAELNLSAA